MTTKGNLVFEGRADGEFDAYNATTGEKLWSVNVGSGISAPPVTYAIDGKQYVSLLVGWGGAGLISGSLAAQNGWKYKVHPRRLITFALDGKVPMPPSPPPTFAHPVDVPGFKVDPQLAAYGKEVFSHSCFLCHGGGVVSGGLAPDLRESPIPQSRDAFKQVLLEGVRVPLGMPRFADFTDKEIDGLMHYIRDVARKDAAAPAARK
jgi:quinohemoprotein ethanol dehydrogenase